MQELETIVTVDGILDYLEDAVSRKLIIGPSIWLNAAQKLNALLGGEHEKLFTLAQQVAQMKVQMLNDHPVGSKPKSVAEIKMRVEASNEYREMNLIKAKIGRVEEMIRISKIQARMKDNEMSGY